MTAPKIGVVDIETAPIRGNVWGLFDQNVGLNQIDDEWAILSFTWKPLGGKKKDIIYFDNRSKEDPRDDFELCAILWHLLDDYDFAIAQNGKRFDLRKIRARLIMHGFEPPSPIRVIDTLMMARQVAAFTSNKLEWLSAHLTNLPKGQHKEFPGYELWRECLAGNQRAWAAMEKYNVIDVDACELVYLRLRPWVTDHPNLNVHNDETDTCCPRCASPLLEKRGFSFTNVGKYQRYRCSDCGGWSTSRYTLNSTAKRKALLK